MFPKKQFINRQLHVFQFCHDVRADFVELFLHRFVRITLNVGQILSLIHILYATMFFFYSVYDGAEDKESAKKQFQEAVKELEKSICKEW